MSHPTGQARRPRNALAFTLGFTLAFMVIMSGIHIAARNVERDRKPPCGAKPCPARFI
jgi:hypothetical protein